MDEKLVKDTLQEIRMPGDMAERIAGRCREAETSELPLCRKFPLAVCAAALILLCVACSATAVYLCDSASEESQVQGEVTADLMPYDLTYSKKEITPLLEGLEQSGYLAVYMDNDVCLRVTGEGKIQGRGTEETQWKEYTGEEIPAETFAQWLLHNDPLPSYPMDALQERLSQGAQVQKLTLAAGQEVYVVTDEEGAQLELVQEEKRDAVLLDGQHLMLTSSQLGPLTISETLLTAFYGELTDSGILTEEAAEQDLEERLAWIGSDDNQNVHIVVP